MELRYVHKLILRAVSSHGEIAWTTAVFVNDNMAHTAVEKVSTHKMPRSIGISRTTIVT